jgi:D-inositol-3-phosphate glycosyltransferase
MGVAALLGRSADTLRVVVATHYFPPHVGGIESVALRQVERLAAGGAHVDVHTSRLPRMADCSEARSIGEGSVHIARHTAVDPLVRLLQVPVPIPGVAMLRALRDAAQSADVVVAHGHTFPSSALAAWAARAAGRPFVLVQHSPWIRFPRPVEWIERIVDLAIGRRVIAAAATVVCVSEHTADYVRSLVPDAPVRVIPNGVDTSRFHARTDTSIEIVEGRGSSDDARPVVLSVGRSVRRNGWHVLLEAWRRSGLADRAELHVAGTGPDDAALRAAAEGIAGVRILGRVADEELADRYRSAALVVVPTLQGVGFGMVAAEALACGVPVVATDHGGHREVVRDGEDGLLVPPGEAGALAQALIRLMDDGDLRERLAQGARARELDDGVAADALLDVLRTVARSNGDDVVARPRPLVGSWR